VDSGTSMAAPYVSGAAALYKAQHPYASPSEVIAAILGAGTPPDTVCDDGAHGYFTGDPDTLPEPLLYSNPTPSQSSPAITPVSSSPTG
jgi:subtilisin